MSPPAKKRKSTPTANEKPKKQLTPQQSTPLLSEKPKKKKQTQPQQSTPLLSLPYDLLLNCIARVSRLYYPTLSLVSKSFRYLIASPELYKVRSLMGQTESCLYVCVCCYTKCRWFTLCRKPDKTLTNDKKNSSGYVLASASIPLSPHADFRATVAVGSNIYNIDTSSDIFLGPASVSILDCRSHTWREASIFRLKRTSFSASVLDGKIYVAGYSFEDGSHKNSIVVFDTKTQTFDSESIPCVLQNGQVYRKTACIDGKFHVVLCDRSVAAYNSKESRWDVFGPVMANFMNSDSYCEIDSVLYSADQGAIRWFDTGVRMWKELKGLVGLPKLPHGKSVRLADYGGKMAVLWERTSPDRSAKMVSCAEIALERCEGCQIWGKVEWFDHVLTSYHYDMVKVVAATL